MRGFRRWFGWAGRRGLGGREHWDREELKPLRQDGLTLLRSQSPLVHLDG